MAENQKLYGYVGKILRINLTDSTTETIPTSKYVPKYIGGRGVCHKIFWDEVKPGVGAFDPENKLIFMTGATTGTAIPTGGRSMMTGISPTALPEQYSHGSIGGWIGTVLKYAGYDGFILEGKAPVPTYVLIEDDKIHFLPADGLWGKLVHETQEEIYKKHGPDVHSLVIGPAGEHLCRNATLTTSSDSALSKAGFGAVFGAKNLKAVAIKGKGEVKPADIDKVLELREKMGGFAKEPNKIEHRTEAGMMLNLFNVPEGYDTTLLACSPGCNSRCNRMILDRKSPFSDAKLNRIEKCISVMCYNYSYDVGCPMSLFVQSERNHAPMGKVVAGITDGDAFDMDDPDIDILTDCYMGDKMDLWGPDYDRGNLLMGLCNDYGLDKWELTVWYSTWLAMAKKEGLLDDLDFGMEPDISNSDFVKHFVTSMVYREGIGDIFAEGMARALRKLGKEKYGDAIYHGRYNQEGKRLDIPVSLEFGWGHSCHWQGRGFQATPQWYWLASCITGMLDTRDCQGSGHFHDTPEHIREYRDDPEHSELLIRSIIENDENSEIKDSVTTCEWQAPNLFWPEMEAELYTAATGLKTTRADLVEAAERSKLLYRAILMRNFGRDRELEVKEVFPYLTYPDPWEKVMTWDGWNDFVDLYYKQRGWDLQTGWPTRSVWEAAGLGDIADEMETIGKLPPEGRTEYTRSACPVPPRKKEA